jgi:hypothetical protein
VKQTQQFRHLTIARTVVQKMSRKTSIYCDLCGAEISPNFTKEESAQIRVIAPNEYRGGGGQRIDLCLSCYEKFINFMETGR